VSDNKKCFLKYINNKRRSKENIVLIFVVDEEKAETFSALFASVFNNIHRPWAAQSHKSEDH